MKDYFNKGNVAYFLAEQGEVSALEKSLSAWAKYNNINVTFQSGYFVAKRGEETITELVVRMERIEEGSVPEKRPVGRPRVVKEPKKLKRRGRRKGEGYSETHKKIINLLKGGISPREIVKRLGVTRQYVYSLKKIDNI